MQGSFFQAHCCCCGSARSAAEPQGYPPCLQLATLRCIPSQGQPGGSGDSGLPKHARTCTFQGHPSALHDYPFIRCRMSSRRVHRLVPRGSNSAGPAHCRTTTRAGCAIHTAVVVLHATRLFVPDTDVHSDGWMASGGRIVCTPNVIIIAIQQQMDRPRKTYQAQTAQQYCSRLQRWPASKKR